MLLKGGDIELRALEPTDLELLYTWENNTEIWNVSQTLVPFSKFVLHQYLENQHLDIFSSKQLRLVIINSENIAIGLIDLFDFDPYNKRAGVGVMISNKKDRGQGFAKKALSIFLEYIFDYLSLNQIYANVGVSNKASIALFSSLGFIQVGIKKDWFKKGDSYEDEILFQCFSNKKNTFL
jgi:diamine N-acetyltransferase